MKALAKEFKEFISKGNVVEMAVGIIIGSSFTSIVDSIVNGLISPLIGVICGGIDFSSLNITVGEAVFGIGEVINAIIKFLLTALVLFFILKGFNKLNAKLDSMEKKAGIKEDDKAEAKTE